ncbi:MAG TPA: T9SS type A sorting domain-containing protein [Bacteroidia bacterium]|jgi:hypothetical protein
MKKILLIAFSGLFIGRVAAQSLQIMDTQNNNLPNGTVSDLWYDVNASAPYEDYTVKNTSGSSKFIKCRRYEISTVNGTSNVICWYICYAPAVSVSQSVNMPSSSTHTFTTHYYPSANVGTTILNYTFWDSLNPADSAWFTVRWHITPTGVNNLVQPSGNISNVFPNPANVNANINFQLNNTATAIVRIYNIVGTEVKRINVNNKEGLLTFSVSDLEPGIYFCSFIADDKVLATRKLTVTK